MPIYYPINICIFGTTLVRPTIRLPSLMKSKTLYSLHYIHFKLGFPIYQKYSVMKVLHIRHNPKPLNSTIRLPSLMKSKTLLTLYSF